jgi:hypothetical protein
MQRTRCSRILCAAMIAMPLAAGCSRTTETEKDEANPAIEWSSAPPATSQTTPPPLFPESTKETALQSPPDPFGNAKPVMVDSKPAVPPATSSTPTIVPTVPRTIASSSPPKSGSPASFAAPPAMPDFASMPAKPVTPSGPAVSEPSPPVRRNPFRDTLAPAGIEDAPREGPDAMPPRLAATPELKSIESSLPAPVLAPTKASTPPLQTKSAEVKPADIKPLEVKPTEAKPLAPVTPPALAAPSPLVPLAPSATASAAAPAVGKRAKRTGIPFDPIKENGPIFVDWPKPKLVLLITGCEDGYMEPCGCAGLERMKGGLSRRQTMLKMLRQEKGWPVVALDVGGLTKGYGPQTEVKFRVTVEAMRAMRYDAMGFGRNDLRLPAGELVSVAAPPSPFLSANVGLFGFEAKMTDRTRIIEANGLKVGVTSILGKKYHAEINNQEIEMADPEKVLADVVAEIKKNCNLLVLLAHATKEESIALAQKFPAFGLVVTSNGHAEPPSKPERIENTQSLLIEVGEKGMYAVVLGFYDDPKLPVRYQRVTLDSRFAASSDMKRLMEAYQDQLKMLGVAGLCPRPTPHPQSSVNGDFVGSEKCQTCHEKSYDTWKKSGHAKAWNTLLETDPPRNFDPECISCHVVGWHPTSHFPYKSGFLGEKETPHLGGVGCESCHGPGGAHVAAESGGDSALQAKLQKAMVVTKEEAQTNHAKWCQNCHDLDNSPDFKFETYWPDVEHYEE